MTHCSKAKLLANLLDQHGAALVLYASQWTDEPDDCVQEALVELARQRVTPESPAAWLYHVTKRKAINAARSARRRRDREQLAFRRRLQVATAAPDPAAAVAMADSVASLDERLREAVVLRAWAGLTFEELGAALGVSTATAARRYDQALDELRTVWLPNETESNLSANKP